MFPIKKSNKIGGFFASWNRKQQNLTTQRLGEFTSSPKSPGFCLPSVRGEVQFIQWRELHFQVVVWKTPWGYRPHCQRLSFAFKRRHQNGRGGRGFEPVSLKKQGRIRKMCQIQWFFGRFLTQKSGFLTENNGNWLFLQFFSWKRRKLLKNDLKLAKKAFPTPRNVKNAQKRSRNSQIKIQIAYLECPLPTTNRIVQKNSNVQDIAIAQIQPIVVTWPVENNQANARKIDYRRKHISHRPQCRHRVGMDCLVG